MANTKQMETSLLTEHLRYTPLTLLDDIINTVNELVNRAVDAAEEGLLAADPATLGFAAKAAAENSIPDTDGEGNPVYAEARAEIEEGVHKLETLLEANVDKNFDKLEIYVLRNVLTVPEELVPWVRLGHYENLTLPTSTPTTPHPTLSTLQALHRKLRETRRLHTALLAERTRNDALLSQLHALLSAPAPPHPKLEDASPPPHAAQSLSFLTSAPAAKALGLTFPPAHTTTTATAQPQGPLATTTSFALSQLPALRGLLSALRPHVPPAPPPGPAVGVEAPDDGGAAPQRRRYVEAQARRALERRGHAVAGEPARLAGRRVAVEEVVALEGVVGGLGPGARAGAHAGAGASASVGGERMEE